jgi:pimeloyl-ACP methyl ester carboxylesterase
VFVGLAEPETGVSAYVAAIIDSIDCRRMINYTVQTLERFRYVDEGPPQQRSPVVLLHGMLGGIENWRTTAAALAGAGRRVIVPVLPVYDLPGSETSVTGLTRYTSDLIDALGITHPVLVGNSLGGHVALLYTLRHHKKPAALVLTGASGIHEVVMGESTPRRFDREYVRERAAYTFYDPSHASEELVDGIMEIVADRARAVRLIKMARSARDEKVEDALHEIRIPTLLIWGTEDRLTPPAVARRFKERMFNAELELIPACGHAPMMERPDTFNRLLIEFLSVQNGAQNGKSHASVRLPSDD